MFRMGSSNAGIMLCCWAPGCKSDKCRESEKIVNISLLLGWSATREMIEGEDPEWYQAIFQGKTTYLIELILAFSHFLADFSVWSHPVCFTFKSVALFRVWCQRTMANHVNMAYQPVSCSYSGTKVPAHGFKMLQMRSQSLFFLFLVEATRDFSVNKTKSSI